jgi:hypothetical protein
MENQLTVSKQFSLVPSSLSEAIKYSEIIANSDIAPRDFKGKPGNVLVAVQMGAELGLSPLQALQNIAIINGRGSIWGDAALAIVQTHPDYEAHEEFIEGEGDKMKAICRVKRKGSEWHEVIFDVAKAKKANLWGKAGPWTQYPDRMLQMRARGFALRDKFSDALKGLITAEEAGDYVVINPKQVKDEPIAMKIVEDISDSLSPVSDKFLTVQTLIQDYKISQEMISKWCKKASIASLEEASNELLDKFIQGVYKICEKKEDKDYRI